MDDSSVYRPIVPRRAFYSSEVLGLQLQLEGERLRFYVSGAALPEAEERFSTLERMVREAEEHREQEARRREQAECKLSETLAELERLRNRQG